MLPQVRGAIAAGPSKRRRSASRSTSHEGRQQFSAHAPAGPVKSNYGVVKVQMRSRAGPGCRSATRETVVRSRGVVESHGAAVVGG
ncbi:hypothetical protein CYJ73_02545 [Gordonia terrae]|uniref:Uncharacterized protein n=1 Tax=Gordonia terrae TaxID=2055 RepID=A0A2I1REQ7_9ACTN|nr:hypothetical protein CYJ73_02545 [Gordonia terrae]